MVVGDGTEGREELRQALAAEQARRRMSEQRFAETLQVNDRLKCASDPTHCHRRLARMLHIGYQLVPPGNVVSQTEWCAWQCSKLLILYLMACWGCVEQVESEVRGAQAVDAAQRNGGCGHGSEAPFGVCRRAPGLRRQPPGKPLRTWSLHPSCCHSALLSFNGIKDVAP